MKNIVKLWKYHIFDKSDFLYKLASFPLETVYFALKLEYFPRENASTGPIFSVFIVFK